MNYVMTLDADFEAQLRHHLPSQMYDKTIALQVIKNNPYAMYLTYLDYLRAGSQIIRTNTYRAIKTNFATYMNISAAESLDLINLAVKYAQKAVLTYQQEGNHKYSTPLTLKRPLIAGRCGSYTVTHFSEETDILKQHKNLTPNYVSYFYQQRIETLINAGSDLLAFESIPSLEEAELIVKMLKLYPNMHAWITFRCTQDGKIMDGRQITEVITKCYYSLPEQIIAVGVDGPNISKSWMQTTNGDNLKIPLIHYLNKLDLPYSWYNHKYASEMQYAYMKDFLNIGTCFVGGGTDLLAEDVDIMRNCIEYYRSFKNLTTFNTSYQNKGNLSKL